MASASGAGLPLRACRIPSCPTVAWVKEAVQPGTPARPGSTPAQPTHDRRMAERASVCPQYNTYSTHYKEVDCLREQIEPFLYNAGVDIILHGARPRGMQHPTRSAPAVHRGCMTRCPPSGTCMTTQWRRPLRRPAVAAAPGRVLLRLAGVSGPLTGGTCRAGHVHAYERTFQTVNYTLDGCAPRWLTMGGLPSPFAPPRCS